ncbi:MAG: PqqD family peptide modification chaperone [Phycisphaerales bacterium]|nr:PqqD family peptide modification chaperone [Phycisphaerales bacterium]
MSERPTFSPFWHRVRAMKPRLRPHVQITRQHYRGRRWHVVRDPSSNQFYRLNPIAHEFVGLFDGSRTVEEIWQSCLERHGDAAPTQGEVIQLISQLYNSNLLAADVTPETEQLLRRGRKRLGQKAAQQAIGIMYFRIRVFNPDRYLSWIEPILRPVLNKWGFFAWLAFVLFALVQLAPHWEALISQAEEVYRDPTLWPWLVVVFIVTKAIHETGHGVICKRFGGQVPEFGFMLLVLFPAPYVDASAAWAFASKWKRIAVGAGGMIFELFVASIAALVWLNTQPGSLVHQIAYNAIFTASVSTILFNANPLMRFDGYFILADLLEVPNLMQRSMNQLKHFFKTRVYRMKNETPPSSQRGETAILYTYGILALAYRIFLFFSITLYVMGKLFAIGLVLAIWTAGMWFILPVGKFVHWLASHPSLADFRPRAIATSLAMIAIGLGAVGLVPMPDHRRATGVVESEASTGVFFGTDGFVEEAHARIGEFVRAGDPILTLRSDELRARLAIVNARIAEMESIEQQAMGRDSTATAQVARQRIDTLAGQADYLRGEIEKLVVRAPHDGRVVAADPASLVGSFAKRGEPVCRVVDESRVRVTALLKQQDADWHYALGQERYRVEVRFLSRAGDTVPGRVVKVLEAGQLNLPHPALGFGGGGSVATAKDDTTGLRASNPQFVMHIAPIPENDGQWTGMPGERVRLRFTLPRTPLAWQWIDRLHKLVQGKVNV